MDFNRLKKLKELQRKFAHELAVYKQEGGTIPEEDKFTVLTLAELNRQMVDAINEYLDSVGDDKSAIASAILLCASFVGTLSAIYDISKNIENSTILEYAKEQITIKYNEAKNDGTAT